MPDKEKGLSGWIPIFAGGKQIDMSGAEHDGDALIEKAVASFDPAFHEPPAVIGHPQDDSPAWGWVSEVKAETANVGGIIKKILLAKFKDTAPEFQEWVGAKRYKKRSAAFYPDGRLRHVGWLGGMPPAVKGLPEPQFAEGEAVIFAFAEESPSADDAGMLIKMYNLLKTWVNDQDSEEAAEKEEDPAKQGLDENNNLKEDETDMAGLSEEQVKEREEAAQLKGKQEGKAAAFAEFQKQQAGRKISIYLATPVKEGGPVPALVDAGLSKFLERIDSVSSFAFSEDDGTEKQTDLDFFIEHIAPRLKSPKFGEHAGRRNAPNFAEDGGTEDLDPVAVGTAAKAYRFSEKQKGNALTGAQADNYVRENWNEFEGK